MQPPTSDICVICGVRPAETVDHVPPKGFFKGVVNAQLRTVPACSVCNNGASSDDEDVRFFHQRTDRKAKFGVEADVGSWCAQVDPS